MANEKFTPGPWEITAQEGEYCLVNQCGSIKPEICSICTIYCTQYDRVRADAALIATAPELYDVIDRLVPWLENDPNADSDEYCSFAKEMRRVLKKARGES